MVMAKEKAAGFQPGGLSGINGVWQTPLAVGPRMEPGLDIALVPGEYLSVKRDHLGPRFIRIEHIMVRRDPRYVEPGPCPVGQVVTPGRQTVVEMVGCDVTQMLQSRRQQVPGEGVFPLVQKEEYLATFAPDILLVVII